MFNDAYAKLIIE